MLDTETYTQCIVKITGYGGPSCFEFTSGVNWYQDSKHFLYVHMKSQTIRF